MLEDFGKVWNHSLYDRDYGRAQSAYCNSTMK